MTSDETATACYENPHAACPLSVMRISMNRSVMRSMPKFDSAKARPLAPFVERLGVRGQALAREETLQCRQRRGGLGLGVDQRRCGVLRGISPKTGRPAQGRKGPLTGPRTRQHPPRAGQSTRRRRPALGSSSKGWNGSTRRFANGSDSVR